MNILVTCSNGFIGYGLCQKLKLDNHSVIEIKRMLSIIFILYSIIYTNYKMIIKSIKAAKSTKTHSQKFFEI